MVKGIRFNLTLGLDKDLHKGLLFTRLKMNLKFDTTFFNLKYNGCYKINYNVYQLVLHFKFLFISSVITFSKQCR